MPPRDLPPLAEQRRSIRRENAVNATVGLAAFVLGTIVLILYLAGLSAGRTFGEDPLIAAAVVAGLAFCLVFLPARTMVRPLWLRKQMRRKGYGWFTLRDAMELQSWFETPRFVRRPTVHDVPDREELARVPEYRDGDMEFLVERLLAAAEGPDIGRILEELRRKPPGGNT